MTKTIRTLSSVYGTYWISQWWSEWKRLSTNRENGGDLNEAIPTCTHALTPENMHVCPHAHKCIRPHLHTAKWNIFCDIDKRVVAISIWSWPSARACTCLLLWSPGLGPSRCEPCVSLPHQLLLPQEHISATPWLLVNSTPTTQQGLLAN